MSIRVPNPKPWLVTATPTVPEYGDLPLGGEFLTSKPVLLPEDVLGSIIREVLSHNTLVLSAQQVEEIVSIFSRLNQWLEESTDGNQASQRSP